MGPGENKVQLSKLPIKKCIHFSASRKSYSKIGFFFSYYQRMWLLQLTSTSKSKLVKLVTWRLVLPLQEAESNVRCYIHCYCMQQWNKYGFQLWSPIACPECKLSSRVTLYLFTIARPSKADSHCFKKLSNPLALLCQKHGMSQSYGSIDSTTLLLLLLLRQPSKPMPLQGFVSSEPCWTPE